MDLKQFLQSSFNKDGFIEFISERFYRFAPNLQENEYLGKVKLDNKSEIGFFIFEVKENKDIANSRVGFHSELKNIADEYHLDGAIGAFYSTNQKEWRLSFVEFDYDYNDKKQATHQKRFTYLLGINAVNTPFSQFEKIQKYTSIAQIKESFSVERVSKEFFEKYKNLFEMLNQHLLPQLSLFEDENHLHAFSKKLLGRIVFLYFLQKKGWLGVKKDWGDGDKNFLSNLYKKDKNDFYFKKILPLFFETLNKKRDDNFSDIFNSKIPFLNGGLFDKSTLDDNIFLEDTFFGAIFELFDRYNFTIIEDSLYESEIAIDPEMLGRVFENLLEENYRKGKGAFYTPREIVGYMCKSSIDEYLKDKNDKLQAIKKIKVLDPAIGSGAFPMGILQTIVQTRVHLGDETPYAKLKREIIENSIYGVDIDGDAVDIAKLRFWLSLTVDETVPSALPNLDFKIMQGNSLLETINKFPIIPTDIYEKIVRKQTDLFGDFEEQTLLTRTLYAELSEKIHKFYNDTNPNEKIRDKKEIKELVQKLIMGYIKEQDELFLKNANEANSLQAGRSAKAKAIAIKTSELALKNSALAKKIIDDMLTNNFQTKELFLYKLWFGEVMQDGGFDIVIGNPPYLRVQGIDKVESEKYKKLYKSATGSYDLYVIFTEQAIKLLGKNGLVNFIMPHKWVNSAFGKGLREFTKDKFFRFISFREYQVFNASTYTSLVWFKNKSDAVRYIGIEKDLQTNSDLKEFLDSITDDKYTITKNEKLNNDAWTFSDNKVAKVLAKLDKQPLRVKDVFEKIFQGIATSKDSVYFLSECIENNNMIEGYSKELDRRINIEKGLVKPLLKGDDVHKYETLKTNKVVVFPYFRKIEDGKEKAELYSEEELQKSFPKGYAYLKECEGVLRDRESGRFNIDGEWFQFGRKQGIIDADKEKLIQPDISMGCNYAYDKKGEFYSTTTNYGYKKYDCIKESYKFYMAILNSKVLWWYLQQTGTTLANGFFRFKPDYINPFPLPKISQEEQQPFDILVDKIIELKKIDSRVKHENDEVRELENKIDEMVYKLYGLSEDEIKIITGEK